MLCSAALGRRQKRESTAGAGILPAGQFLNRRQHLYQVGAGGGPGVGIIGRQDADTGRAIITCSLVLLFLAKVEIPRKYFRNKKWGCPLGCHIQ
nr:hypothetical protein Iba_chr08cCG12520 [Ipomoea batatas]